VGYNNPNYTNNPTQTQRSVEGILSRRSLECVYQPIVNHQDTGIFAYEALSRPWFEDVCIQPDLWFRAAYECGRSEEADLLAFTSAIQRFTQSGKFLLPGPLFVNVLPSSLSRESFLRSLERFLHDVHCDPTQLVIEVVEYVSFDPVTLAQIIRELRTHGIRIALDDVGVGASNLNALVALEPDFVKVDRSMIQGICDSDSKQRILSSLVTFMGGGESIVAEGVETADDLVAIKACGVHLSQGYYWIPPLPADELSLLLTQI